MEKEVRQIMFEKLEEMAELNYNDCQEGDYPCICNAMNETANILLGEHNLSKFSVDELIAELTARDSVEVIEKEYCYIKDKDPIKIIILKVIG